MIIRGVVVNVAVMLYESYWNEYRRLRNKVCPVCENFYSGRGEPKRMYLAKYSSLLAVI